MKGDGAEDRYKHQTLLVKSDTPFQFGSMKFIFYIEDSLILLQSRLLRLLPRLTVDAAIPAWVKSRLAALSSLCSGDAVR